MSSSQFENESVVNLQSQNDHLQRKINKLKKMLQSSLNIGEQITSNHLQKIFIKLKSENIVRNYAIYNNVIVENETRIHQLDHLVLCNHGFFAIETKHWKGDIYFNFNQDNLKDHQLDGLKKYLFTDTTEDYITFILNNEDNQFQFNKYGNPYTQVMKSTTFCQEVIQARFIDNIIYFNHRGDGQLFVGSRNKYVATPTNEQELEQVLVDKINKNKAYTNMDASTLLSFCDTINQFANNDASIISIN